MHKLTISQYEDLSEKYESESRKDLIQYYRDEIELLDKIAVLTNNFKHLELVP